MKESEFSDGVKQILNEFEAIPDIQPSAEWNLSLMNRLVSSKPRAISNLSLSRYNIMVLFIILINIGFILNTVIRNTPKDQLRDMELKAVSQELLINPI
jgi:hypothetical protein